MAEVSHRTRAPPAACVLPEGWTSRQSRSDPGRTVFYNARLDLSQWGPPPSQQGATAAHYNTRVAAVRAADEPHGKRRRRWDSAPRDTLAQVRAYNNWVKATALDVTLRHTLDHQPLALYLASGTPPATDGGDGNAAPAATPAVLDLACGRGGDLGKFLRYGGRVRHYTGIDAAAVAVAEAKARARRLCRTNAAAASPPALQFVVGDVGHLQPWMREPRAQYVYLQAHFAINYLPRRGLANLFRRAAGWAAPGACFVLTYCDGDRLPPVGTATGVRFANAACRVVAAADRDPDDASRAAYTFSLGPNVSGCTEYAVTLGDLEDAVVAAGNRWEVALACNLADVPRNALYDTVYAGRQGLPASGPAALDEAAAEVVGLYGLVVLRLRPAET